MLLVLLLGGGRWKHPESQYGQPVSVIKMAGSVGFDGKSVGEQIALLKFSFGIHPLDIHDAFEALVHCAAGHLVGSDEPFAIIIAELSPTLEPHGSN
jgi:hypothetical protein